MENKPVVMITGASKGLGRELTLAFAQKGAYLAICARGEKNLQEVKKEAEGNGASFVLAVTGDLSKSRDVERFVAMTEELYGKVDVLINNASILGPSPMPLLLDYPEEDFMEVLKVNALSPFLVTKRILPGMILNKNGSIINVTSEAGSAGYAGWGAYGISKFALEGLTETWADELMETGVRVNMVDPGEMDTDMHRLAVPDCDYDLANPKDVINVFLYLASDSSKHINGQRFQAQEFMGREE
ncbi:NAD(P)-dependent dehydrogenase (short-subunit alcohol dehydrogenase family) [Bacillus sp. SLBN-46]|jgi:NAD(P)-dependent dehydrogenase (short-subunit alcohol dehydrogenase family)|uniref:SDR family oxidoreductase n=1 Tax=Bacillus sp. SLBN-46 TaxID=3042283 RepID=UPI00285F057E|nr:SDR family oxidoreductase [Bacillus sp. SLBN-46]MDR6122891.1 NAD(P)-dependent dehydrogenase (short-subunit alcohol dehydrogenase family) [Bacillus sp. SLBN-46]